MSVGKLAKGCNVRWEVLFTEGDWYIGREHYDHIVMRHGTEYNQRELKHGCGWYMSYGVKGNQCTGCRELIPESILTLYALYTDRLPNWDATAEELYAHPLNPASRR